MNALSFIIISKLIFTRKPIAFKKLRKFTKHISLVLFNLQLRYLFGKKLVKTVPSIKNYFLFRINTRQNMIKNFYRVRIIFPEARVNFFRFLPYNGKDVEIRNSVFEFYRSINLLLPQKKKKAVQDFPSLQKIVILKNLLTINHFNTNKSVIQYFSYPTFCFEKDVFVTSVFLKFFKKIPQFYFLKVSNSKKGFYRIFNCLNYYSPDFIDLKFQTKYENILSFRTHFENFNLKLAHCLYYYSNNFNLIFLCELCSVFSPRTSDKIFFDPFRFYIIGKNRIHRKKGLSKKLIETKKNSFKIIIESNFRIYAYRKKNEEIGILQQFSEKLYQLPNLFVGELTIKSMNKAFKHGISSENILMFFQNNLHWICKKIPPNVIEQIKIWEIEKNNNFIHEIIIASSVNSLPIRSFNCYPRQIIVLKKRRSKKLMILRNQV